MRWSRIGITFLGLTSMAIAASNPESIDKDLESIRARHNLPALAAITVKDGNVMVRGAVGVRKLGANEPVTLDDEWHIGSCTKSMTATLAAVMVERGKVKWDTTIGDVFPEWKNEIRPEWNNVTLEQLLTHRSGAPADPPAALWAQAWKRTGTPVEQRLAFVHGILVTAPEARTGTKYIYSNQGYAIAGAMLERITGKPWEEMMRTMLFEPLGMKSAGFGAPGSPDKLDQPWGHTRFLWKLTPVPPDPDPDNPPAIAPAGRVHCSLADLARYAAVHANGETAGSPVLGLRPESFVKLHTPAPGQDYAMGWIVARREWAGGIALNHGGSNTMFLVNIWVAPAKNMVCIAATNAPGDTAFKATDEAVSGMIGRTVPK